MVTQRRFKLGAAIILSVALAVGVGLWLASRAAKSDSQGAGERANAPVPKKSINAPPPIPASHNGNLRIASLPIETAMNEARWRSALSGKTSNSTPADTFVSSMTALARGDIRTFALAMSKQAQSAFLEGRSIDDPYFQTISQKMAEAGFQSPTIESFKAERTAGACKLVARLSSVRGKQKINEEITMELVDSSSGWMIDKYECRITQREAAVQDK